MTPSRSQESSVDRATEPSTHPDRIPPGTGAEECAGRLAVRGRRYMISAVHYLATMGGLRILAQGGNALDASVAAGLCINVVQPHMATFGGAAPIIISLAPKGTEPRRVVTISGLGRWPWAATLEGYLAKYGGDLPGGVPRTVTPAAPDAWLTALAEFGPLSLAEVLAPRSSWPRRASRCTLSRSATSPMRRSPAAPSPGGPPQPRRFSLRDRCRSRATSSASRSLPLRSGVSLKPRRRRPAIGGQRSMRRAICSTAARSPARSLPCIRRREAC